MAEQDQRRTDEEQRERRRESNRRERDGRGRFIPSNGGGYGYSGDSAFDRISAERARRWMESGS